jgi:aerobic carbon-monoxide dehydrogenase large subunit
VVAVLTGADTAGALGDLPTRAMEAKCQVEAIYSPAQPILAWNKVGYVGQRMAVGVGRDCYAARDAVDLIKVNCEPLPSILDSLEAVRRSHLYKEEGRNLFHRQWVL